MNRSGRLVAPKWAFAALALGVAMALGGCGRKGPLDLPPTASTQPLGTTAEVDAAPPPRNSNFLEPVNADQTPRAERGQKRGFLLDPLLRSD